MPLAASIHIYQFFSSVSLAIPMGTFKISFYITDGQNLSCFSLLLSNGGVCLHPSWMNCWCWCQTECSDMHIWKAYAGILLEYLNMTTNRKFISIQFIVCTLIWHSSWNLVGILNSVDNLFKSLLECNCIAKPTFLCRLAQGQ